MSGDGEINFEDFAILANDWLWPSGEARTTENGLVLLADDFDRPNGLAFSPDETMLYVDDEARGHIRAFDVSPDGSLSNGRVLIDMRSSEAGAPDGMIIDPGGPVFGAPNSIDTSGGGGGCSIAQGTRDDGVRADHILLLLFLACLWAARKQPLRRL